MQLLEYSILFVISVSGITAEFTVMSNPDLGETRAVPAWNETCECINDPKTPHTIGGDAQANYQIAGGLCDVGVINVATDDSSGRINVIVYFDTDPEETSLTCYEQNGAWNIPCPGQPGLWTRNVYCAVDTICPGWR